MAALEPPSNDEVIGMAWWNRLTREARAAACRNAESAMPAAVWWWHRDRGRLDPIAIEREQRE